MSDDVMVLVDEIVIAVQDDPNAVVIYVTEADQLVVQDPDITVQLVEDIEQIIVTDAVGAQGPPGPPGPSGGAPFVWTQSTPAATWIIPHNRGYRVQVTLFDDAFNEIESDVVQGDLNTATITFASPITGSAVLT